MHFPRTVIAALVLLVVMGSTTLTSPAAALFVSTPCCSSFAHVGAAFGTRLPWGQPGVRGVLVKAAAGCSNVGFDQIALVDRGAEGMSFEDLVKACQVSGARAVVVRNTEANGGGANDLIVMGSHDSRTGIVIPAVFVSTRTGERLEALLVAQRASTPNGEVVVELYAADDTTEIFAQVPYFLMTLLSFLMFGFTVFLLLSVLRKCAYSCARRREERMRRRRLEANGMMEPLASSSSSYLQQQQQHHHHHHHTIVVDSSQVTPVASDKSGTRVVIVDPIAYPVVVHYSQPPSHHLPSATGTRHVTFLERDPNKQNEPLLQQQEE